MIIYFIHTKRKVSTLSIVILIDIMLLKEKDILKNYEESMRWI